MKKDNLTNQNYTLELAIAPNLTIQDVSQELIPIDKILGIDQAYKCEEVRKITPTINLVAIKRGDMYEIIQSKKIWEPEVLNKCFSHLHLLVLPVTIDELMLQKIIFIINTIHCNRSLHTRNELLELTTHNPKLTDIIKEAYLINEPLELLGANSYNSDHVRRLRNKIILKRANKDLEKVWDEFANEYEEIPLLEGIYRLFPHLEQDKIKEALLTRLKDKKGSLRLVWKAIKSASEKGSKKDD